jgi:6-phosphogluconolactonase
LAITASFGLTMHEIHVADVRSVAQRLAEEVGSAASSAIAQRGLFSIALPGGSVATECFPTLAALPLDWNSAHFFWADERAVPPSDPESNYGLTARLWLTPARVPDASVHRMPADSPDLSAAADAYGAELSRVLGPAPPLPTIDVALLGMGPDGHVASLFPGHPVLAERHRLVSAVTDAPKPPPRRLTLTMPVLANARRVIVVAFGTSKAAALGKAVTRQDSPLPVAQLLRLATSSLVLADEAAGAVLRK